MGGFNSIATLLQAKKDHNLGVSYVGLDRNPFKSVLLVLLTFLVECGPARAVIT